MLIALEGQDCTGKTSLAPMIRDFLASNSFIVSTKSFPERTPFIESYLSGGSASGINPQSFQMTCFLQKRDWQKTREAQDRWWVLDRWGPSGTVYGYIDSDYDVDFDTFMKDSDPNFRLLEKPVIGFILTVSPEKLFERLHARGDAPSCYESLSKQRVLYDTFSMYAKKDKSYKLIDTTNLTLEEVFEKIKSTLTHTFFL